MSAPALPLVPVALAAIALASGCDAAPAADAPALADGCAGLVAGDLVITEIMANPEGEDAGREWFELYNASGATQDLRGVALGSGEKRHVIGGAAPVMVPAGGYLVLGDAPDAERPAYVAYGYGKALGGLPNGKGRIDVACGTTELDAVAYERGGDGRSRGLTGAIAPDALANDDPSRWCTAAAFGSPGEANERCAAVAVPGRCEEDGVERASVAPGPGDLVISEVMANPRGAPDARGEWIELEVRRDVDLDGLELGVVLGMPRSTLAGAGCRRVAAGTLVVLAHEADPAQNGGLPRVDATFAAPALANSGGTLVLSVAGTLVDEVRWSSSGEGVALSRDPESGAFCPAVDAYGGGDRGTPGAVNPACPLVVPAGMCVGEDGALRPIVAPGAGELVITEVMADPEAVPDAAGEWIELRAGADVDLNGLELGLTPPTVKATVQAAACLRVTAGARVVLAHGDPGPASGGLPEVAARFGFALGNGASGVFVGAGGAVLDAVSWTGATRGASLQLEPARCVTPATVRYGAGDRGTPGAENVPCE